MWVQEEKPGVPPPGVQERWKRSLIIFTIFKKIFSATPGAILDPPSGVEPSTSALEGKVLTTGPSGKSLEIHYQEQKLRGQREACGDEGIPGPGMDTRGDSAGISSITAFKKSPENSWKYVIYYQLLIIINDY